MEINGATDRRRPGGLFTKALRAMSSRRKAVPPEECDHQSVIARLRFG